MQNHSYILVLNSEGERFSCSVDLKTWNAYYNEVIQDKERRDPWDTSPALVEKEGKIHFSLMTKTTEVLHGELREDMVPVLVKEALICKTRKDVSEFIKKVRQHSDTEKPWIKINQSGWQDVIYFKHQSFFENSHGLSDHSSDKLDFHDENTEKMLEFVENRETFFQKNYKAGFDYQQMAWYNPMWLLVCLEYYFTAILNKFQSLLQYNPTHYCEDFDLGYKSANAL